MNDEPDIIGEWALCFTEAPPVSVNKLYATGPHGKRYLTKPGEHFSARLRMSIANVLPWGWGEVIDAVYTLPAYVTLELAIGIPNFYNASWRPGELAVQKPRKDPKTGKMVMPKAEPVRSSAYQKIDAENYVKLTQDAIARATCIDDSVAFDLRLTKHPAEVWSATIRYRVIRDTNYGH